MFQTTLQLVGVAATSEAGWAVAGTGTLLRDFEICDLTLDCNLARQPKPGGGPQAIGAGALYVAQGVNVRVRRVRVINFGTSTATLECFPIFIEGSHSSSDVGHNVVENCIIEQQHLSNARELTFLNNHAHFSNNEIQTTARDNYLNGDFMTGRGAPDPVEVLSVAYANPTVTFQTRWPHRLEVGDRVWIAGASQPSYNGRFTVSERVDDWIFRISRSGLPTPPTNPGITAQRHVPEAMQISGMSASTVGGVTTVTITTAKPHRRLADDWVRISGVKLNGVLDLDHFNGAFQVLASPAPTAQRFRMVG